MNESFFLQRRSEVCASCLKPALKKNPLNSLAQFLDEYVKAQQLFSRCASVPPTIEGSGSSQDVSAIVKQEIILECKVQGVPFPTVQWYKDRK